MTAPIKYSRRDFLKAFTGGMANAVGELAAAVVPDPSLSPSRAAQLRAENLARAQTRAHDAPTDAPHSHCTRCNVEFVGESSEPLCPACRERDEQSRSLLTGLYK